jgi:hypothetical protein
MDQESAAPLRSFIAGLDAGLSAQEMLQRAWSAGYRTTIASIHSARTALGIAKPRSKFERRTEIPDVPAQPSELVIPSDEAILEHLIVKVGLDAAQRVFERVADRIDRIIEERD